jgi:hypothetical protein
MYELQALLETYASDPQAFVRQLLDANSKLYKQRQTSCHLDLIIKDKTPSGVVSSCQDLVAQQLHALGSDAVRDDLMKLYKPSKRLAVNGFVSSLRTSEDLLGKNVSQLEEYSNAGEEQRQILLDLLVKAEEKYGAVLNELDKAPAELWLGFADLIKAVLIDPLMAWAPTQNSWQVLYDGDSASGAGSGNGPRDEIEQRLHIRGAKRGKLTCSLIWNNKTRPGPSLQDARGRAHFFRHAFRRRRYPGR